MPFTTNTELKAAIADKLARADLTTQIIDFISLFECEAARELFKMRPTETSTTLTPSSGSVSLPADYMGWRRVTWAGSPRAELEYVHPSILQAYYPTVPSTTPALFTIEGTTLKVRPLSDTGLEFDYFARTGPLATSLNWLFTNNSDCYYYGALEQAYLFTSDYDQAGPWAAKKQTVYDSIKKLRFREDGALTVRVMGYTP